MSADEYTRLFWPPTLNCSHACLCSLLLCHAIPSWSKCEVIFFTIYSLYRQSSYWISSANNNLVNSFFVSLQTHLISGTQLYIRTYTEKLSFFKLMITILSEVTFHKNTCSAGIAFWSLCCYFSVKRRLTEDLFQQPMSFSRRSTETIFIAFLEQCYSLYQADMKK